VIEADEYDTAFFDKRSKFVHTGRAPRLQQSNTTTPTSSRRRRDRNAVPPIARTVPPGPAHRERRGSSLAHVPRAAAVEVERFRRRIRRDDAPSSGQIANDGSITLHGAFQGRRWPPDHPRSAGTID
jgi:hypothetical protein